MTRTVRLADYRRTITVAAVGHRVRVIVARPGRMGHEGSGELEPHAAELLAHLLTGALPATTRVAGVTVALTAPETRALAGALTDAAWSARVAA